MPGAVALYLDNFLRGLTLAALGAASLVALTHWAVHAGHLAAFGGWARTVRRLSDPALRPLERRLVRAGRNPQDAPYWLLGLAVFGGILVVSLSRWLVGFAYTVAALPRQGPGVIAVFVLDLATNVLLLALIIRVLTSWLGAGRFLRVAMWAHRLTDWLVLPIRKRLPAIGPFDWSPFVAYIVLLLARAGLYMVF